MGSKRNFLRRREQKYLCTSFQIDALRRALDRIAEKDEYGESEIHTVYFDTNDFSVMRKCMNAKGGGGYKEKLRLRSYGPPSEGGSVYLELKKKLSGVTYKRRISLAWGELRSYLAERCGRTARVENEIDWFLRSHQVKPQFIVSYKRLALRGREDKDFRVTLDSALCCREVSIPSLEKELASPFGGRPMIAMNEYLLEIKAAGAVPYTLSRTLSELGVFPVSFSKSKSAYSLLQLNGGRSSVALDAVLYAMPRSA